MSIDTEMTPELRDAIDADREAEITELRNELTLQLATVSRSVDQALWLIGRLASPEVYDADYAEGETDTAALLTDAARLIRAARALDPATTTPTT